MKITLGPYIPLSPKHGMTAGREAEVTKIERGPRAREDKFWIMGDVGESCAIFRRECTDIKDEDWSLDEKKGEPDAD